MSFPIKALVPQVLLLLATAPVSSTVTSMSHGAQQPPPGYEKIGEHGSGPCPIAPQPTGCVGLIPGTLADEMTIDAALRTTLKFLPTVTPGHTAARKITNSTFKDMSIQAAGAPSRVRLKSLSGLARRGIVVAVIETDPRGPVDPLYGIGQLSADFDRRFYLVAHDYREVIDQSDDQSRQIARWSIYGVRGNRFVRVGNSGKLRFCRHSHGGAQRLTGAQFTTCAMAGQLALIEAKLDRDGPKVTDQALRSALAATNDRAPALDAIRAALPRGLAGLGRRQWLELRLTGVLSTSEIATVVKAFDNEAVDPAWFTCGIGCCTAEL